MNEKATDEARYEANKELFLDGLLGTFANLFDPCGLPASLEALRKLPGEADRVSVLERILDAVPELVSEGRWDVSICDLGCDAEFLLSGCVELLEGDLLHDSMEMDVPEDFVQILRIAHARANLALGYSSIAEIALLAEMNERSVRNAVTAEGEERLDADSDGRVTPEEAVRWLSKRRNFKPTIFYNSQVDSLDVADIKMGHDLLQLIAWRAKGLGISPADFAEATGGRWDEAEAEYFLDVEKLEFASGWVLLDDPKTLKRLAELLQLNPSLLIKTAMELKAKQDADELLAEQRGHIAHVLEDLGLSKALSDRFALVNPSEKATAKTVRETIQAQAGIKPHPKYKPGNRKIDAYLVVKNGRALAHEHNLKKQSIWVRREGLPVRRIEVPMTKPENLHSGLQKYLELNHGDLCKFSPDFIGQVQQLLDAVTSALPIPEKDAVEGEQ